MTQDSKESLLRRWSRRKQEAMQSDQAVDQAEPKDQETSLDPAASTDTVPTLTDADMPPIESLDENSDYSGFMSEGVSDELRNLALRKLFKAPAFNIRDGLDEYDEDYTFFEKLGDVVTSDMKHHIEMKELREREALALETEQEAADEIEAIEDDAGDFEAMESAEDEDITDEQAAIIAQAKLENKNKQEQK